VLFMISACLLLSGCGQSGGDTQITVTGSTTMLPIVEVAAERFTELNPEYKVLVSGVGSSAGIESVSSGSSDIGTSSRDLKDAEMDLGLVDTPIAYDAIVVIVHPGNPVDSLSREQVKDIFMGRITNWSEVGGKDLSIGLVNRDEASGTREAFSKIVLDGEPFDPTAAILPGTGQVRSVVAHAEGAVGFISLGFVTSEVRALQIDGVDPTVASVTDGSYRVQRSLHVFTNGEPTGNVASFVEFLLSSEVQDEVVRDAGFVSILSEVE